MCVFKFFLVFILTLRLTSGNENTFVIVDNLFRDIENTPDGSSSGYEMNYGFNSRKKRDNAIKCPTSCGSKNHLPVCYCDDLCHSFNDCCFQASKAGYQKTISSPENAYVCDLPYPANQINPHMKPFGITLARTCLERFQRSFLAKKCFEKNAESNILLHIVPVTSNDGLTFANVFCALCNDREEVVNWDLETVNNALGEMFVNQNISRLSEKLGHKKLFVAVPSSGAKPRICIRTRPSVQDTSQIALCSKYQEPIMYAKQVFKNHHCINKSHFQDCLSNHQKTDCQEECIEENPIELDQYILETDPRHLLYRISFKIQMEYDLRKCKQDEILSDSRVKCARVGCRNGEDVSARDNCELFDIYYRNFKLGIHWSYQDSKFTLSQVQRYVTVLLYVLYRNKIETFADFFSLNSPENSTCGFQLITMYTSYRNNLNIQDVEKLRALLSSFQISYTETYQNGSYSQLLQRLHTDVLYKTNADFRKQCSINQFSRLKVLFQRDKDVLIRALARYRKPFLFNLTCNHIHLTISITDDTDGRGNTHRQYKPTEFYCVNGKSGNTLSIWSTLFLLFCGLSINLIDIPF